jgi:hypothetical protein
MDRARLPDKQCNISAIVDLIDQGKIFLRPPFQRGRAWQPRDRQLLIDSIAKDYDIGKFFLSEVKGQPYDYDTIDGQQRLETLVQFKHGKLTFPPETGSPFVGNTLNQLSTDLQIQLRSYILDIVVMKNADDREKREQYRRLQLGKRLTNGERLKASYGQLHHFIEGEILKHKLFDGLLGFKNNRDVYFEVSSQMVRLSFEGVACDIEYKNLEEMYYQYQNVIDEQKKKGVRKDLNFIQKVLEANGGTFHPDKANSISIYLFTSKLRREYVADPQGIINFIKDFEAERHAISLTDPELVEYNKRLAGGSGKRRSVQFRFQTLMKRFLAKNPDTKLLHDIRVLSGEQRLAVYWRDKGLCRACNTAVSDKDFEIHHTEAWHKGGPTTVENSLTLCKLCHHKVTSGQLKL